MLVTTLPRRQQQGRRVCHHTTAQQRGRRPAACREGGVPPPSVGGTRVIDNGGPLCPGPPTVWATAVITDRLPITVWCLCKLHTNCTVQIGMGSRVSKHTRIYELGMQEGSKTKQKTDVVSRPVAVSLVSGTGGEHGKRHRTVRRTTASIRSYCCQPCQPHHRPRFRGAPRTCPGGGGG